MSGETKVSICNKALILLGARPIVALTEGTDAANVCAELYDNLKWSVLAQHPWTFAMKKVQLARLVAAPLNEWRYQYTLPTDMVGTVEAVYTSSAVGARPLRDFDIQGGKLLANFDSIWIDYKQNIAEGDMPPHFVTLLSYVLAANMAEPITDQNTKAQWWTTQAWGTPSENMRGGYFRVAANIDSMGRPPEVIDDFSLIDVRN